MFQAVITPWAFVDTWSKLNEVAFKLVMVTDPSVKLNDSGTKEPETKLSASGVANVNDPERLHCGGQVAFKKR